MSIRTLIKKFDPDNNPKQDFIFMQLVFSTVPLMFILIAVKDFSNLGAQGLILLASMMYGGMTVVNVQRYKEKNKEDECWKCQS